jgi:serine/threonine-protein kinase
MNEPHNLGQNGNIPSSRAGDFVPMAAAKSKAMPTPEETGGRYQLTDEIARGTMAVVLRGRDLDLGRDMAVKVLREEYANRQEVARRFIAEAQIHGQLQHPGIVPVYDIGRFGNRPFFTMKLVKGKTLAALLAERAGPREDLPQFLNVVLLVAQTLAYAHAKGVIHRDLEPANIMVGAFGEVQVMDWGLSRVVGQGNGVEEGEVNRDTFGTAGEAGSLLGTPAYMAPEQANGYLAIVDRRMDVFGLGAILCEVLTGEPPYGGGSAEEVRRKAADADLTDALARLNTCGADGELVGLAIACLAPGTADRPKDAQAVAEALTTYLDGMQSRLQQAQVTKAEAKGKRMGQVQRRLLTMALAAMGLLAVLGAGHWVWAAADSNSRQKQLVRDINEALDKATTLREQARAVVNGGRELLAQAREQMQRALALAEYGPVDAGLIAKVRRLQAELDEEEKDRKLVVVLEEARLVQAETLTGENRFALERAVPMFREAFRAFGLPAGKGEPAAAAVRIRERPALVREAIIAALDEWIELAENPAFKLSEPHLRWLRALAEATEPDNGWGRVCTAGPPGEKPGQAKGGAGEARELDRSPDPTGAVLDTPGDAFAARPRRRECGAVAPTSLGTVPG